MYGGTEPLAVLQRDAGGGSCDDFAEFVRAVRSWLDENRTCRAQVRAALFDLYVEVPVGVPLPPEDVDVLFVEHPR